MFKQKMYSHNIFNDKIKNIHEECKILLTIIKNISLV